jgi:hypothetical protein
MNHFIKLPHGEIINVAHVQRVVTIPTTYNADGSRHYLTRIDTGQTIEDRQDYPDGYPDPDGAIYAYFESIAQEIGEES